MQIPNLDFRLVRLIVQTFRPMNRALILVSIALLLGSASYAQQSSPAPAPIEQQAPPGRAASPSSPAQAVVPVPVPIAPTKPNGPVQKSLVRITATSVEREGDPNKYRARVLFVAHDCDLALITVDAPNFFKYMVPL